MKANQGSAKETVHDYWQTQPCGSSHSRAEPGSQEFFDEVEQARYRLEPFIPAFAEFNRWRDRNVLEIGVGLGSDFVRFARAGARLSGIDLTEASIELVRRRLALEGFTADLRVTDAEALPFHDDSFDLVYSWGVLHHTPDTDAALRETRRVLRPGGEARMMFYSRRSWVAIGAWVRYALLRARPWRSFKDVIAQHMESPGTKAYTANELERMFSDFSTVSFTRFVTPYDCRVGGPLTRMVGPSLGWFVGIRAVP